MKLFRKTLCVLLAALLMGCTSLVAFAANDATVTLRIEGVEKCEYYNTVTVASGATVYTVMQTAAANDEALTFEDSDGYIYSINGVAAGTFTAKGWDGWQYRVNDIAGMGTKLDTVKDGDSVVFYYSDEWGETGFCFPKADLSKINDGIISFTVSVDEYDANWNWIGQKEEALTGYTLYWDGAKITPDEAGVATIPAVKLLGTNHSVQIERKAENGLPTVLRFAPDYTVQVEHADGLARFLTLFVDLFAKIRAFFTGLFNK